MMFIVLISGLMSLGGSTSAGRDTWISAFIVGLLVIPIYYMYYYPIKNYKNRNFFEINEYIYGKNVSIFVNYLYIIFATLVCVVSFSRYFVFVKTVALEHTSIFLIGLFMLFTVVYASYCGLEPLARFSEISIIVIGLLLLFTLLVAFSSINYENAKPILENGLEPVVDGVLSILAIPFLEGFAFICLLTNVADRNKVPKVIITSGVLVAIVLGIAFLRNLLILGDGATNSFYYPSYQAISLITFGSFFQRQEVTVSATFIIADIIRISVLTIFICQGISHSRKKREYKRNSVPVMLFVYLVSILFLQNAIKLYNFVEIYKYILFLPFFVMPFITFMIVMIKTKKTAKR